jgi:serine protease Do
MLLGLVLAATPALNAQEPDAETRAALDHAKQLSKAFAWSASRIKPSVVEISTGRRVRSPYIRRDTIVTGTGSGVIVAREGFILTNHHVIRDVEGVVVSLSDGRQFHARIIGVDSMADLAVLKIDATDLTPATFAPTNNLTIGQWVLAVGSPFGLEQTVTAGIVSAIGRRGLDFASANNYESFIQTDAAINPGSSGGPLVNLEGEVVGINTAIQSQDGSYLGIAFAIPVDMARNVVDSVMANGTVARGYLGVALQPLNQQIRTALGYSAEPGLIVDAVMGNAPADAAGLIRTDIITHLNGQRVSDVSLFRRTVALMAPGDSCTLRLFRQGQSHDVVVTLTQHPGTSQATTVPGMVNDEHTQTP